MPLRGVTANFGALPKWVRSKDVKPKLKVGVLGATGMVGQRFLALLEKHPWFEVTLVAASPSSAGKTYEEAVKARWSLDSAIPAANRSLVVKNASDVAAIAPEVDFVFCATDMTKDETIALEDAYAAAETPLISNNGAQRATPDVPMMIPEVNPDHAKIIEAQRKRRGTKRGFVAVKPNCSLQSYIPAIHPLLDFGPTKIAVCTYQAISGAGKTFVTAPEILDNIIPVGNSEEEKSEREPLKIWGAIEGDRIVDRKAPVITAQCLRVPTADGHFAAVSVAFDKAPSADEIIARWRGFIGRPQKQDLPSAPKPFLTYFEDPFRPQTKLDRDIGNGMGIAIGRLRRDPVFDYRFVALSHNTIRGAAGGAILTAELLVADGYIERR
jgi:aspartate-semialdehyde dehydrogenase